MRLQLRRGDQVVIARLEVAERLWSRTKGLLGRAHLEEDQALWIRPCNSVHTFFMRFAIDLVFLDRQLKVIEMVANVGPGRVIWPIWRAHSVVELPAGSLNRFTLQKGEQLYVDHSLS